MEEPLRQRLESLNRGPLTGALPPAIRAVRPVAVTSGLAARPVAPALPPPTGDLPRRLPGLVRRGEVVANEQGEHLVVRVPLEEIWHGGERLVFGRQEFLRQTLGTAHEAAEPGVAMRSEFAAFVRALPDRALLLDLETCGLAGSALFLIGILRQWNGAPTVEMLLARTYAEEPAVLASFWQRVEDHDVLATFNGKTFDWPMVQERSVLHRIAAARPRRALTHLDILHHARRRWKRQLPDCRLLTLESAVCRRRRVADVAGHRIPAIYADYVRSGVDREMDAVLYHNACDLVTLLDLALRLAA